MFVKVWFLQLSIISNFSLTAHIFSQHLQIKRGVVQLRWEIGRFIISRLNPDQSRFSLLPPWWTLHYLSLFFSHDPCLPHESSTQAILIKTFIFIITKYLPSLLFPFSPKQAFQTCYSTERVSAGQTVSTDRFVLDTHEQLFSGDNICFQEPGTRYRDDLRKHWRRHSCGWTRSKTFIVTQTQAGVRQKELPFITNAVCLTDPQSGHNNASLLGSSEPVLNRWSSHIIGFLLFPAQTEYLTPRSSSELWRY